MSQQQQIRQLSDHLDWIFDQVHALKTETLLQVIDELKLDIQQDQYEKMAKDVYDKAKKGYTLSDKQRRVLVNIICQPRY